MTALVAVPWQDEILATRSFTPEGINKEGLVTWRDVSIANELAQPRLTFSHRAPVAQNNEHLYRGSIFMGTVDANGAFAYRNSMNIETRLHARASEAERKRLLFCALYYLTATDATTPVGYSMLKAQGIW